MLNKTVIRLHNIHNYKIFSFHKVVETTMLPVRACNVQFEITIEIQGKNRGIGFKIRSQFFTSDLLMIPGTWKYTNSSVTTILC